MSESFDENNAGQRTMAEIGEYQEKNKKIKIIIIAVSTLIVLAVATVFFLKFAGGISEEALKAFNEAKKVYYHRNIRHQIHLL